MKKFGLLVGNGFTTDLIRHLNLELDSSKPLHFFGNSKITYLPYENYLSNVKLELLHSSPELNNFSLISQYAQKYEPTSPEYVQLRKFLALSYSMLQIEIDKYNLTNWKWYKWINKYQKQISFVVSFNYDLIIENVMKLISKKHYRVGSSEPSLGVPIIKPHGSIDFDHHQHHIMFGNEEAKWNTSIGLVNIDEVLVIQKDQLLNARTSADLVPPLEENYMFKSKISWIEKGYFTYDTILKSDYDIDSLVIIGHSYSKPDRPEIDHYLSKLKKGSIVHLVGTTEPEPLLINKLEELHLRFKVIGRGKNDFPW